MPFIFSLEIIRVIVPELCLFFWTPESTADAAAVIPNGAKIFLPMELLLSLTDFLLNNKPINHPDWIILDICV